MNSFNKNQLILKIFINIKPMKMIGNKNKKSQKGNR